MEEMLLKKNLSAIQQLFNLLGVDINVLDTSSESFLKIQNFIDENDAFFVEVGKKMREKK